MKSASSFTILVAFVCLALVGIALVPLLPVKLNPSRNLPGFTVEFTLPDASSRVVEMEVTSKLESMLSRVEGVKKLESTSGNGYGSIRVELDRHADLQVARFEASTVIRQTWPDLPDGVSYPTLRVQAPGDTDTRFMSFTLNAPVDPVQIQRYAEEHIKPRLAQIEGIYQVSLSGATPLEWQLTYDADRLRALGLSVDDLRQAIGTYYHKEFMGTHSVDKSGRWMRLALMPVDPPQGGFDADRIPIQTPDGHLLRLSELVRVRHVEEKPQSYYRINGLNSIYLTLTATATANQLRLSQAVKREMARIAQNLPPGYEVNTGYDATEYIQEELNKIYFRTGLTVLILLVFVWAITRRAKYLFLIVSSLTVNIAVAVIGYYLFRLELQLYSLAGITISLNLVIDSTIIMADHLMHRHNLKAFLSVLAATLTTMGALSVIYFLPDELRLHLQDFAAVVLVNLSVSLLVSLFFVPALMDKTGLSAPPARSASRWRHRLKRLTVRFTRVYERLILLLRRYRPVVYIALLLAFGLPVFLLPQKVNGDSRWARLYNSTLGSRAYLEDLKPYVDKALGGTLRLFVEDVYNGSYFTRNDEVVLSANANLPNGSTLEQMNQLMKGMEVFLSQFKEIRQFHTTIYNANRATIDVYFKKAYRDTGFPYTLKAQMVTRAQQLGGGSWTIYGLLDQGFSNDVRETAGSHRVTLYGYNYDELYAWADTLRNRLLQNRRIKEVFIQSEYSWWKDDYREFYFDLRKDRMARAGISAQHLFYILQPLFGKDMPIGTVPTDNGSEKIKLSSRQSADYDIWSMRYVPGVTPDQHLFKLSELAEVEKGQMPQEIAKVNQQYRLCMQYDYIGTNAMAERVQKENLDRLSHELPIGYTAKAEGVNWGRSKDHSRQYLLLLLIMVILFFTTGILFNSLRQPLAILCVIPASYIGVFLTFYQFRLNFDQGGFASFILLCGITVNAGIYILNEYNNLRKRYPRLSPLRAYSKAWNAKIIPISLTVLSTILGFIPFMVGTQKESFWFPLAAGTIGGLVMSVVAIFFLLPTFVPDDSRRHASDGSRGT